MMLFCLPDDHSNMQEDIQMLSKKFTAFLASPGKKSQKNILLARECIQECNSAFIVTKDTLRISIENLGPNINSNSDDYSEVLSADGKTIYLPQEENSRNRVNVILIQNLMKTSSFQGSTMVPGYRQL